MPSSALRSLCFLMLSFSRTLPNLNEIEPNLNAAINHNMLRISYLQRSHFPNLNIRGLCHVCHEDTAPETKDK